MKAAFLVDANLLSEPTAAMALHHDFVVATRNARDFSAAGLRVVDPFQ